MTWHVSIPGAARTALDLWLQHHDTRLPGFVEGLYVVGSIALADWQPGSDVDIVAVSSIPATDAQVGVLRVAHEAVVAEIGEREIDGPFVTWDDIRQPPAAITRPWALAGEFHHDDGCFELNPVTWLTLAKHAVAVRGPEPEELDIYVDRDLVRSFVADNTAAYWRSVAAAIDGALDDPDRIEFDAELTSWSVLGIARMLFTARTGDVTSKSGAGLWLIEELPQHRQLVERALVVRARGTAQPIGRHTARAVVDYVIELADLVDAATQ